MPISNKSLWRIGYDSIHPNLIPRVAEMVFPYVKPSQYAWTDAEIAMFTHADVARITVHGAHPDWRNASIIDVEGVRSDPAHFSFTPAQARQFVIDRNAFRPGTATVYCNLDKLPHVMDELQGLHWWLFLAHPGTRPEEVPPYANIVAKQYVDDVNYDKSVIYDASWHPKGSQ